MKIIFLDCDGVLNHDELWKNLHNKWKASDKSLFLSRQSDELDPKCVEKIDRLITDTGAKVVISSSWRKLHNISNLKEIFKEVGMKNINSIVDITPNSDNGFRGDEINMWLSSHQNIEAYVIFDDDSDFHENQPLIKTSRKTGITDENINSARRILTHVAV